MGASVRSVCVNVSVVLAEILLCSYFSETYAVLLVLPVPKVAFSPGTLMLDAPGTPKKASPHVGCKGQLLVPKQRRNACKLTMRE